MTDQGWSAATAALKRSESCLRGRRFSVANEDELQRAIAELFAQGGVPATREAVLSPRDRVDFLTDDGVAVEVKTQGSPARVSSQLDRYTESERVLAVLLVTTQARLVRNFTSLNGKPVTSIYVGRI